MQSVLKKPPEIIVLIIGWVREKQDLLHLAITHSKFSLSASYRLRTLYSALWIRWAIWQEDALANEVNTTAVGRILEHMNRKPLSSDEANQQFKIKTSVPRIPEYLNDNLCRLPVHAHFSLLHLAAYSGLDELVKILLQAGARMDDDLVGCDAAWKHTPLFLAASNQKWDVVLQLIQAGAKVGQSIFWPILFGSTSIFGKMLEAEPEAWKVKNPETRQIPLAFSIVMGNVNLDRGEIVEIMLRHRAADGYSDEQRHGLFKEALRSEHFYTALVLVDWARDISALQWLWMCVPRDAIHAHHLIRIIQKLMEKFMGPSTSESELMNKHMNWLSWPSCDITYAPYALGWRDTVRAVLSEYITAMQKSAKRLG